MALIYYMRRAGMSCVCVHSCQLENVFGPTITWVSIKSISLESVAESNTSKDKKKVLTDCKPQLWVCYCSLRGSEKSVRAHRAIRSAINFLETVIGAYIF
jgi:hypothetical protein